jgi:hypothetical protein
MGRFDWFKRQPRPTFTDAVFGVLQYDHASWSGRVAFPPTGQQISLILDSDGSEPSPLYPGLFAELVQRYPALRSAIGAALFDVWKPYLEDWPGDRPPRATSADALLSLTKLESIMLELPARVRLGYGFAEGGDWDDAVLTVELTDWHISDSCLSD